MRRYTVAGLLYGASEKQRPDAPSAALQLLRFEVRRSGLAGSILCVEGRLILLGDGQFLRKTTAKAVAVVVYWRGNRFDR